MMSLSSKLLCLCLPLGLPLSLPAVPIQTLPHGEQVGMMPSQLREASGLAFSLRNPGLLWLNNDSGAPATLQAIAADGTFLGSLKLRNGTAIDWEDCTSFLWEGKPCLLIADVGDNGASRARVRLFVVAEPERSELSPTKPCVVDPLWQIDLSYPDGPRDCESVAVDLPARRVLLISKRTQPPVIYSVPLHPGDGRGQVATRQGTMSWLERPQGLLAHPFGGQPTGLSISADGLHAALLCYDGVWTFTREASEDWVKVLARPGHRHSVGALVQAEAVGLSADGRVMLVTGEGKHAPLLRYQPGDAD